MLFECKVHQCHGTDRIDAQRFPRTRAVRLRAGRRGQVENSADSIEASRFCDLYPNFAAPSEEINVLDGLHKHQSIGNIGRASNIVKIEQHCFRDAALLTPPRRRKLSDQRTCRTLSRKQKGSS
jgi:hypothetical protein